MKEKIKELIQPIVYRFEESEKYFRGFDALERLHNSAPEDYIPERLSWQELAEYADDMYGMLVCVKEQIERFQELLDEDEL